jgi:hypothetical protein
MKTMREAAASNWRAAAWWLERLDPLVFTQGPPTAIGKREGNKFVADLTDIIDKVVTNPLERRQFENLLTAALPPALRRAWDKRQSRRFLQRTMKNLDERKAKRADPFLTPKQRREDAAFRRELNRILEASKMPLDPLTPPSTTPNTNGNRASTPTDPLAPRS